ncbi:MAG: tail fiber domain-containing protein, partial [Verrucomicrobia bacterium]|nr:tail fiber domain-containing protein [Verrucomicrobiota bacterium]
GALGNLSTGAQNVAVGRAALAFTTTGTNNVAVGFQALLNTTASNDNTAIGTSALAGMTNGGGGNTALGSGAMNTGNPGPYNVALGFSSMATGIKSTACTNNIAIGNNSLNVLTSGSSNIALGSGTGSSITSGSNNVFLGVNAGSSYTGSDSNNISIGVGAGGASGTSNQINIGNVSTATCFIAGIRGKTTGFADAINVLIDSGQQLGTISSSIRFKTDIREIEHAESEGLQKLRPVSFRYKSQPDNPRLDYGLIAEEVVDIYPDLVVYDAEGQPETVQYHKLYGLLIAEIQRLQKLNLNLIERVEALEKKSV